MNFYLTSDIHSMTLVMGGSCFFYEHKKILKAIALIVSIIFVFIFCFYLILVEDSWESAGRGSNSTITKDIDYGEYPRYVDINDVVTEAFVTNDGYTSELSQYMTEDVFKHTNYKNYNVNDPKYTKPFKVDFSLKEVYQTKDKENNLIYVDMIYSMLITDANDKDVGGALNAHMTYTVRLDGNGWYIIKKYERL